MSAARATGVVIRDKRQVTLPKEICDRLDIAVGDVLEFSLENSAIVARPRKTLAVRALREIQQAFRASGITEEELQSSGRRIRREAARERYGQA